MFRDRDVNGATMFNLLKDREHRGQNLRRLYSATTGNLHFLQRLRLDKRLSVHDGCVNTICWNDSGSLILSGSDDQHLAITNPFSGKNIVKFRSGHRSNIFSAKFLPGSMDREVVSCSGLGEIFYTDVGRDDTYGTNRFDCHYGTTYKLLVVPNEAATFLSCGDDGTVRFFDLRTKTSCSKFNCEEDVVIHLRNAVTAMAVDPVIPFHLAVASSDGIVRLYDRRMLKTRATPGSSDSLISRFMPPMPGGEKKHYRITSLNYRQGSHDVLVNYSSENIYLFNTYETNVQQSYTSTTSMPEMSEATYKPEMSEATCKPVSMTAPSPGASTGGAGPSSGAAVGASASSDNGSDTEGAYKPIKRLRLRGDWSDTGPDARPESEEPALTNSIMQRMSDLLTRMLNSRGERSAGQEEQEGGATGGREDDLTTSEDLRDETADVTSTDAAAMFRSVMFRSASAAAVRSLGNHSRPSARFSVSSEGLVSPELSSQDLEGQAEAAVIEPETDAPRESHIHGIESDQPASSRRESPDLSSVACQPTQLSGHSSFNKETNNRTSSRDNLLKAGGCDLAEASDRTQQLSQVVSPAVTVVYECSRPDTEPPDVMFPTGNLEAMLRLVPVGECSHRSVHLKSADVIDFGVQKNPVHGAAGTDDRKMDVVANDLKIRATTDETRHRVMSSTSLNPCDSQHTLAVRSGSLFTDNDSGLTQMEVDSDSQLSGVIHSQVCNPVPNKLSTDSCLPHASTAVVEHGQLGAALCVDPNSESSDSISEQMSTSLHIKAAGAVEWQQLPFTDASLQSQPDLENADKTMESEDASLCYSPCCSQTSVSRNKGRLETCLECLQSPHDIGTTSSSSMLSASQTYSLLSSTSSWSGSTIAIAEGVLSSLEDISSQCTFIGVSSPPNLRTDLSSSSVIETITTVSYTTDSANNVSASSGFNTSTPLTVTLLGQGQSTPVQSAPPEMKCEGPGDVGVTSQVPVTAVSGADIGTNVCSITESSSSNNNIKFIGGSQSLPSNMTPTHPPKPSYGCHQSETLTATSRDIPSICTRCGKDVAANVRDMDCLQVEVSVRSGLCPHCYRQQGERSHQLEESHQKEASMMGTIGRSQSDLHLEPARHMPETVPDRDSENILSQASLSAEDNQDFSHLAIDTGLSSHKTQNVGEKPFNFAPYNSGKMIITSQTGQGLVSCPSEDDPAASSSARGAAQLAVCDDHVCTAATPQAAGSHAASTSMEASGKAQASLQAMDFPPSTSDQDNETKGCERQRRVGYSLPPTGNFQLHESESFTEDEDDDERAKRSQKAKSERERMSLAAQKIQEVYRKKREAKERAKMLDVPQPRVLMKYSGHRNCRTMIKEANFYGDHYVMSGSDCGRILVWERETGRLVMYMDADKHVVNCIQPNMYMPVVASAGIDYDIKIWSPSEDEAQFDEEKAEMIIRRNELMLEETRDTVTVPAAFMLRILSSLSQIRTGRNMGRGQSNNDSSIQE